MYTVHTHAAHARAHTYTHTHARTHAHDVNCNAFDAFWSVIRVRKADCDSEIRIFLVNLETICIIINYSFFFVYERIQHTNNLYIENVSRSRCNVKVLMLRGNHQEETNMQVLSTFLLLFTFGLNRSCYLINCL